MTLKKIDIGEITKAVKNCTTPKQKTIIEKIDISTKWEFQLPQYAQLYSNLNEQGKKEMIKQLTVIGKLIDRMQTMRKEKESE
jgi:hypothetical protein